MVEIWLRDASQPMFREKVKSIYEKGSYTCIQLEENVEKYPTDLIFRIVEPYEKVEPCENVGPKDDACRETVVEKEGCIGVVGKKVFIGDKHDVKVKMVETMAGVKLSAKGRAYVSILFQLTSNLDDIAKTIRDLADHFELSEG